MSEQNDLGGFVVPPGGFPSLADWIAAGAPSVMIRGGEWVPEPEPDVIVEGR